MIRRFDVCDPEQLERAITAATSAVRRGEVVVVPTESAYGLATDAFRGDGLARLRHLKNRGAELPVPVLIGSHAALDELMDPVGIEARELAGAFWPGLLTLVGYAKPSLTWAVAGLDDPTVSLRMPLHPVTWALAKSVGPLALTGANIAGADLPTTCDEAAAYFGNGATVYLDAGPCLMDTASSVVDVTASPPRLLRAGGVTLEQLRTIVPDLVGRAEDPPPSGVGEQPAATLADESQDPGPPVDNSGAR
ncbi:MAG: L-threonylcarbamoyladenylate synthase [Actinomycetes bacterium]